MALIAVPGQPYTMYFQMYAQPANVLADPAALTLDITMGGLAGVVGDTAGPYSYAALSPYTGANIIRTGTGLYQFTWLVPPGTLAGAYVSNWTYTYDGGTWLVTEDFYIAGGTVSGGGIPVPSTDVGYWTGSLAYTPQPGTPAQPVTISFGTGPDANGTNWQLQKFNPGWSDGPDVQGGGVIPKSGDHGAWASPQYYAARITTWQIFASAVSEYYRDVAEAQFQAALPVSDLAVLTLNEPVPKQLQVRRSGILQTSCLTTCDITFIAQMVAPDPRKYSTAVNVVNVNAAPPSPTMGIVSPLVSPLNSPAQTPGGTTEVTSNGTFETRPTLTITGPITSPAVVNVTTGQTISWTGLTVPAGIQLVIDTLGMQAAMGGAYRAADPFSSWWCLPPGTTSTIQLDGQADAGASLSIEWQDAYL